MIRKLLGVPLKMVKRALGRDDKPAAAPPPPVRRSPPPRPAAAAAEGDHGHSHGGGGGHDHGHSHGGDPKPAVVAPPPPPADDGGHSHGGHSHGHSHGGEAKAAPGEEVGTNIRVDESETPNPNARKFTCSITVIEKGSASFNTAEEAASHPLGRHIWALGGVKGIFAVKDFVTVTKTAEADWATLSPRMPAAVRRGLVERNATTA